MCTVMFQPSLYDSRSYGANMSVSWGFSRTSRVDCSSDFDGVFFNYFLNEFLRKIHFGEMGAIIKYNHFLHTVFQIFYFSTNFNRIFAILLS